ncbi:unnamed protein product [Cylindrotheca closterium]|uniref:Uncharacterized protein n=1 Tax=Cylindrotheca closterium TaxID=2856 RepID=A0AAD2GA73_9STRA|nr:unnamed protein product [Cylindrotheca closterium]
MSNPRLRLEHPLVGFWLICSELFDYPWINEFLLEYYNDPPSAIVDAIKQTRSGKSINKAPNRELVKEPDPPCIQKIYDLMYSIVEPGTDVQRDSTSSEGDQVQNSNRFAPLQSDDDSFDGSGIQEFDEVEVVAVKKNDSKAPESSDEDEDTDADDTDDRENIVDDAMEEDDDDKRVNTAGANPHDEAMDNNTLPLTSPKLTATQDSAGTWKQLLLASNIPQHWPNGSQTSFR